MKKTLFLLFGILILSFSSCLNLEFGDTEQIYPESNFEDINEIGVYQFINENKTQITDSIQIKEIVNIFKDSSNYFKNDKIKFNGVKPLYSITFKSDKTIPDFQIYPTEQKDKIEVAFFEPIESESNESSWRNYNRFYLNKKLLTTIKKLTE